MGVTLPTAEHESMIFHTEDNSVFSVKGQKVFFSVTNSFVLFGFVVRCSTRLLPSLFISAFSTAVLLFYMLN